MTSLDLPAIISILQRLLAYLTRTDIYLITCGAVLLALAAFLVTSRRRYSELRQQLVTVQERAASCEKENKHLTITRARLVTLLRSERRNSAEKLQLLESAREELRTQFSALAHDIFEDKSETFTVQSKHRIEAMLQPFHQQLSELQSEIRQTYLSDTRERTGLQHELNHLQELNRQISRETTNLTRALKGDKRLQGTWGEMVLERILEQTGLRKGHEYTTQKGYRSRENRLLKPDVILHLPEEKDVVIDSKVSLAAWERYCGTDDEKQQHQALSELATAIRRHILDLGRKKYEELPGLRSLDFILMFMPIDSAFMAAVNHDESIINEAFNQKIVIVTPTTLMATLKTIENIWRYEHQSRNSLEIARRAGTLYDKFRGFAEDLEKIGRQIDTSKTTYDQAMAKLTRGRGNLVSQAQNLIELGIQVKKELPRTMTDQNDGKLQN